MTVNVPPRSFHHPVATLRDVQIPQTWIIKTPRPPHISGWPPSLSAKFHSRKFLFKQNPFHQIFPKTISPKIFPGISSKIFPAHAMNARFAIFQNTASHLSLNSCIRAPRHAADSENRNENNSPSFHSGIAQPIRALPAPPKTSRDRPPCQRTFSRAAANERDGEPEQPLAPEYHDKPAASSYQEGNQKKQRDDMKRDGVQ